MNSEISIALSSDRKFLTYTRVTIASILCHHRRNISFYLLHSGLSARDCQSLADMVAALGTHCRLVPLDQRGSVWQGFPTTKYLTEAAYYRLSLPSLLPNLDKVIYLDGDILVLDDIQEVWDLDLSQVSCAAMKVYNHEHRFEALRGRECFNSGFMCFNLARMREKHAEERFRETAIQFRDQLQLLDQDILNLVFVDDCLALPRRWNVTTGIYGRQGNYANIPEEEAIAMLRAPSAVHFTTKWKPWRFRQKVVHPHGFLYPRYAGLAGCPWWFRFKLFLKYFRDREPPVNEWVRKYGDSLRRAPLRALASEDLRRAQLLQLKVLREIQRVCQKHEVPFFLIGGSLLGAVRHDGFIPWDDDLDIGMLREDYDRFLEVAPVELADEYWLQHWENDLTYGHLFAKVQLKNTRWAIAGAQEVMAKQGLYVDIFPFDRIPSGTAAQGRHYRQAKHARRLLRLKTGYEIRQKNWFLTVRQRFLEVYASLLSVPNIHGRIQMMYAEGRRQADAQDPVCTAIGADYYGSAQPERLFRELVPHRFEDGEFPIPRDFDAILKHHYGDYMTLPPEEQRTTHGVYDFNFGPYGDSTHA